MKTRKAGKVEAGLKGLGLGQEGGQQGGQEGGEAGETICWDPKDGELCLARMKSGETLMEVRSDSDVQIDCRSWV